MFTTEGLQTRPHDLRRLWLHGSGGLSFAYMGIAELFEIKYVYQAVHIH
jgi:hypothetical protein